MIKFSQVSPVKTPSLSGLSWWYSRKTPSQLDVVAQAICYSHKYLVAIARTRNGRWVQLLLPSKRMYAM